MTWEHYGCGISEDLVVNITDAMVKHGYKDAGYEYVNIDDVRRPRQCAARIVAAHRPPSLHPPPHLSQPCMHPSLPPLLRCCASAAASAASAALDNHSCRMQCWQASKRDSNGKIMADPKTFPHGIKWLADYVHSKGLKFGICANAVYAYLVSLLTVCCLADTDYGTATCEGRPGTPLKYQEIDANTYAGMQMHMYVFSQCK